MNIIGRLTRDAEVRTLVDQRQVVNFSVAVNDSYKSKQGERITLTEFFNCAYWLGVGVANVLKKGTLVELNGRVSAKAWVGNNGEPKATLNFHTSEIKLWGGATKAEPTQDSTGIKSDSKHPKKETRKEETDDLPF